MEPHPTTKQDYLKQFIKIYPRQTKESIENLHKLLKKMNLTSINLEKEIKETRQEKEISDFEERLSNKQDWVYKSIPVIESKVNKDKALKSAQILSNLGNLFYDLGKNDEALSYYDQAISIFPDYIGAWKNKGLIFYTMDQSPKAVSCFYHILKLDPEFSEVWLDIGVVLFEMGKFSEAKQCYEKAVQIQPGNLDELSSYTWQFLHKNSYYQDIFNEFLNSMSSDDFLKTSDSASAISKIMQLLNRD
jgi:tetratricopeptide (TPR) repeat protein